jgi:hypothetical protein
MRKRCVAIAVVCAAATGGGAALAPLPAAAAGVSAPAADCLAHGQLTHSYSTAQLQHALATLPAAVSEYSNCSAVLQQALEARIGKLHGGSGSGGDSFLPTWLVIVLIVLVLGGVAFAAAAVRRRGTPGPPPG